MEEGSGSDDMEVDEEGEEEESEEEEEGEEEEEEEEEEEAAVLSPDSQPATPSPTGLGSNSGAWRSTSGHQTTTTKSLGRW